MKDFIKSFLIQLLVYLSLHVLYLLVYRDFGYMGFKMEFSFQVFLLMLCFVVIYSTITISLLRADLKSIMVLQIMNIQFLFPEIIYYIFNAEHTLYFILQYTLINILFVLALKVFSHQYTKIFYLTPKKEKALRIITYSFSLLFLLDYKSWDLSNLLFKNVYKTRTMKNYFKFMGYLSAPLNRVLSPILLISDYKKRNYIFFIIDLIMISFVYLSGAVKSMLFSPIIALIFYIIFKFKGITRNMLPKLFLLTILLSIFFYFLGSNFGVDYLRRVFFVPPYLNTNYFKYFLNRPSYMIFSRVGKILSPSTHVPHLTQYFGSHVLMKEGLNANIGFLTEGFVYFGLPSIVVFGAIYIFLLIYIVRIVPIEYFGMLYMYLYYMNTSLLLTLFVSHGFFIFLLVFRMNSNIKKNNSG